MYRGLMGRQKEDYKTVGNSIARACEKRKSLPDTLGDQVAQG